MQNKDLGRLLELFKLYIEDVSNLCPGEDGFIFYGGGDSYSDADSYSDSYSDNW